MASSNPSQSDRRAEIRRKQREASSAVFNDPLERYATSDSESLRSVSEELAEKEDSIKAKIRAVSGQSQEQLGSFSPPRAQGFIEQRESIVEELASHLKSSRAAVREARANNIVDRPTAKRLLSGMEDVDADILKERAALAKNRVKLKYAILSHPSHARMGDAYMSAIVEKLPDPAGATTSVQGSRDKQDQAQFRSLLIQAYSPAELATSADAVWCPVSHNWLANAAIRAAHIVPYAIGEVNASYIFGLRPEEGYEAIWSYRNGLLLQENIEKALDTAQVVIVPVEDSASEFKLIVLDDALMNQISYHDGPKWGDIHNSKLEFISESRPGKRYLYFHCLISLFRRFRYGGEMDQQKIQMGKVWGTPGKWMSAGILRALAYEIGDIIHVHKVIEGVVDVSSFTERLADERDRRVAVQVRETVKGGQWGEL